MTELLKSWVNDEVGLSEPVEDFEADFANGYLLGELLYRFNQQPTFGKFINKPTADAKISNWCLLEPRIRQLNIKFDSKAAYSIMCQEKGVLTKVLYQIKMAIDKLMKVAPVSLRPAQQGEKQPLVNMPIKTPKSQYDHENSRYFEKSVKMMVENPNDVLLAKNQERFVHEKERQDHLAATQQADEEAYMQMRKDDMRMQRLYQTQREHDFLQEWQAKGAQEWSINQQIARERQAVKGRALTKGEQDQFDRAAAARDDHTDQMRGGIDAFEQTLKKTLAKKPALPLPPAPRSSFDPSQPENSEELDRRLAKKIPHAKNMKLEADSYLANVRAKAADNQVLQKTRQRRRRRFIADSRQGNIDAEQVRLIDFIEAELLKECATETVLEEELWKVRQAQFITTDDREQREVRYEERRAQDKVEGLERDSACHKHTVALHAEDVQVQLNRFDEVVAARDCAAHERAVLLASEMLAECVDLALMMCHHREVVSKHPAEFDVVAWAEMKALFVAGLPTNPLPAADGTPQCAQEAEELGVLAPLELQNYFDGERLWGSGTVMTLKDAVTDNKDKLKPLDSLSAQAPVDNTEVSDKGSKASKSTKGSKKESKKESKKGKKGGDAPAKTTRPPTREEMLESLDPIRNYAVGDVIQEIKLVADPLPAPVPPPDVPQQNIAVVLYGGEYVGRSLHARTLAEKWKLTVIEADELLRRALDGKPEDCEGADAAEATAKEELGRTQAEEATAQAELAAATEALAAAVALAKEQVVLYESAKEEAIAAAIADAEETGEEPPEPEEVVVPDEEPLQAAIAEAQEAEAQAEADVGAKEKAVEEKTMVVEDRQEELRRCTVAAKCLHRMQALGQQARALLRSGQQVSDSLYAQLVTAEVCRVDSIVPGEAGSGGWVCADFPETAAQARELEKCLIGYDEAKHVPVPSDRVAFTLPTTPLPEGMVAHHIGKVIHANAKIPSGIRLFIRLDEDTELLLQRCLGRRHDPVTEKQLLQGAKRGAAPGALSSVHEYHVVDAPPPEDIVCKERLEGVELSDITPDDARKPAAELSCRLAANSYTRGELEGFLDRFGTLRQVSCGGRAAEDVFEEIDALVESMEHARKEKEGTERALREAAAQKAKAEADLKAAEMADAEGALKAAEEALADATAREGENRKRLEEPEEGEELEEGSEEKMMVEEGLRQAEEDIGVANESIAAAQEQVQAVKAKRAEEQAAAEAAAEAAKPPPDVPPEVASILAQQWATAEWQYAGVGQGHVHKMTEAELEQAAAAAKMQAMARGRKVRADKAAAEAAEAAEAKKAAAAGEEEGDPEEQGDAAAKIQARFRGKQVRSGVAVVYLDPEFASAGGSSTAGVPMDAKYPVKEGTEAAAKAAAAAAAGAAAGAEGEGEGEGEAAKAEEKEEEAAEGMAGQQFNGGQLAGSLQDMISRLHRERAMLHQHLRQQTASFASFVRRPDDKQAALQSFQDSFNAIEQDMRFDDRTKAELHRRVDELALQLWELVEKREEEALQELDAIRRDGWVPDHVTAVSQIFEHCVQLEVDHADTIKSVLADRAIASNNGPRGGVGEGNLANLLPPPVADDGGKKKGKDEVEEVPLPPWVTPDVSEVYETMEQKRAKAEAAEAAGGKKKGKGKDKAEEDAFTPDPSDAYPALATCMYKAKQQAEASALMRHLAGLAANPVTLPAEEDGKDKKKKGKGDEDEGAEVKPTTERELECEALEKAQNRILDQRLDRLNLVARSTLDSLRIFATDVHERMGAAVDARVKSEASCISAIVAVAKQAIEEEVTLPFDLRVTPEEVYRFPVLVELDQDTDLILDKGLRLIAEPPPPVAPVVEPLDEKKFSPEQLQKMSDQLTQHAHSVSGLREPGSACMTVAAFVDAMLRFAADDTELPAAFQALSREAYTAIALSFDPADSGSLDAMEFVAACEADAAAVLQVGADGAAAAAAGPA